MTTQSTIRDLVRALNKDPMCKSWDKLLQIPERPVEEITSMLKDDPDPEVRSGAVLAVRWMGFDNAVDLTLSALKDPSPVVRAQAADSIGKLYSRRDYEPLLDVLRNDPDPTVRKSAIVSLNYLAPDDDNEMEALVIALKDPDASVRARAIDAFEMHYVDHNADILVQALQDEESAVRENAAYYLAYKLFDRNEEVEKAVFSHPDEGVRASFIRGLRDEPAYSGGPHYPNAPELITSAFNDPSPIVRARAAETFGRLNRPEVLDSLRQLLDDVDPEVRLNAMSALASHEDMESFERIADELRNPVLKTRYRAVRAIGHYKDERVIELLRRCLSDDSWSVKLAAASELAQRGDSTIIDCLLSFYSSPSARVRHDTIHVLRHFSEDKVIDTIIQALSDPSRSVRNAAVYAFRQRKDPRAVEPLLAMLKEDDTGWLTYVLVHQEDPRVVPVLVEALKDEEVGPEAARALGGTKDPSIVEPLIAALNSPSPTMRDAVLLALGNIGDPRAIEPIIERLSDTTSYIRATAAQALYHFNDPRVFDALLSVLDDEDIGPDAARSLGGLKSEKAVEPLISRLDRTRWTRMGEAIIEALGDIASPQAIDVLIELGSDLESDLGGHARYELRKMNDPRVVEFLANLPKESDEE